MEREINVRKKFGLSQYYVPTVAAVYRTPQHNPLTKSMTDPGYCITLEGAESTLENMILEMQGTGERLTTESIKRIGICLLHMHERGLIHGDFGAHNVGKFSGNNWKILGIGGSVAKGSWTDPTRGYYYPPEVVSLDKKIKRFFSKKSAKVSSIPAQPTYDIFAFGVLIYEIIEQTTFPLCKFNRSMAKNAKTAKISRFNALALERALKKVEFRDPIARDLLYQMLQPKVAKRIASMRDVLNHPFFGRNGTRSEDKNVSTRCMHSVQEDSTHYWSNKICNTMSYNHDSKRISPLGIALGAQGDTISTSRCMDEEKSKIKHAIPEGHDMDGEVAHSNYYCSGPSFKHNNVPMSEIPRVIVTGGRGVISKPASSSSEKGGSVHHNSSKYPSIEVYLEQGFEKIKFSERRMVQNNNIGHKQVSATSGENILNMTDTTCDNHKEMSIMYNIDLNDAQEI